MSGFIVKAACSGRRPAQFAGFNGYQRVALISRLLKDRAIARFVVAPVGYGKTNLIADYAETMFSWIHVFWINGQSPCFIRDVDEGTIAQDCMSVDPQARLVVFDDVPLLDDERSQRFSAAIDELLAAGCEVIVACTPQCDVYGRLQRDRIRIGARDMLLSDEELDAARRLEEKVQEPAEQVSAPNRVPALVWCEGMGAASAFVKACLKEPMPAELLLGLASMFVVQCGSLETLKEAELVFLDDFEEILVDYPHFSLDYESDSFEAPLISVEDVAAGLRGMVDNLLEGSRYQEREQLAYAWADALAESRQGMPRACEVMRLLCMRGKRAPWLVAHAEQLVENLCFYEGFTLVRSIRSSSKGMTIDERSACLGFEAMCRLALDDVEGSIRCAKRLAFDEASPMAPHICCLIIVGRHGNETLAAQACERLEALAFEREDVPVELLSSWVQLALSHVRLSRGADGFASWWNTLFQAGASRRVLFMSAAWLFSLLAARYAEGLGEPLAAGSTELARIERLVRSALEEPDEAGCGFYAHSAALELERAHTAGMPLVDGPLSSRALASLRQVEVKLVEQRGRYENELGEGSNAETAWPARRQGAVSAAMPGVSPVRLQRRVPVLKIKMFGRFEVSIGGTLIEDSAFRRKHVRLMLLILLMNSGHEMSRSALAKMLWPDSADDVARKNFYTAWSKLRKALMLSDGTCPYLVKHQYGCGLETRFVQSDVIRLHEICRELLFGRPNSKSWSSLYSEIDRDYANELLPSEDNDPLVQQAQAECRSRLVDALASATQSVIDEGDYQLAIWFARSAVGHDETREDAYVALMRAQIAATQRTAAMMTYHKCRRVLAERLGVDPSPETKALYEELLASM